MKCTIIIRLSSIDRNSDPKEFVHDFNSIPNFTNYLRWVPDVANQIGYGNRKVAENAARHTNVKLSIIIDGQEIHFKDANHFGQFLRSRPDVAEAVQFKADKTKPMH